MLFAFTLLVPLAQAEFRPGELNNYFWVDKTQYQPGETITLTFTIFNAETSDVMINQVTVETPWFMYIQNHWEGNQTLQINKVLTTGKAYSNSTTIPIPADGRAFTNGFSPIQEMSITIKTNAGTFKENVPIDIANPPIQAAVQDMNTLILLQAVLIILIVVCTALIAAAIFLSARKPQDPYTQQTPTQNQPT